MHGWETNKIIMFGNMGFNQRLFLLDWLESLTQFTTFLMFELGELDFSWKEIESKRYFGLINVIACQHFSSKCLIAQLRENFYFALRLWRELFSDDRGLLMLMYLRIWCWCWEYDHGNSSPAMPSKYEWRRLEGWKKNESRVPIHEIANPVFFPYIGCIKFYFKVVFQQY